MGKVWNDEEVRVLVGWTAQDFGSNMIVRIETATNKPESEEDILVSRMVMNKEQAVQLGNMLYEMSGKLPPKPGKPPLLMLLWMRLLMMPLLLLIGVAGLMAHFCLTNALSIAPATVVVPIDFVRLPLIAVIGMLVYAEALDIWVFIGGAIIFAGNYMNLWIESRRVS